MSRIALAQTTTTDDLPANLAAAERLLDAAVAEGGIDLLAYPEVFAFLGGRAGKLAAAEPLDGPLVGRFREAAARHGMMILLGSLHERIPGDGERVHNTSVLIGADGAVLAHYRKLKLFDVELPHLRIRESDTIAPGADAPPVVDTPIGRLGLTICFDVRFPDLYQDLRRRGAEIIMVPSNFTAPTGEAHWELLLRTRAVETQCYVAAPAQTGRHNAKYVSYGHSLIADPWGRVAAVRPSGEGLCIGEIDLDVMHRVRAELPMGFEAPAEAPRRAAAS